MGNRTGRNRLTYDILTDKLIKLLKEDTSENIYNRKIIRTYISNLFRIAYNRYKCEKIRKSKNKTKRKQIKKLDKFGNELKLYKTIQEAYLDNKDIKGIYPSTISDCCNGKRNSAGGFYWKEQT